jgi:hypothetical protein
MMAPHSRWRKYYGPGRRRSLSRAARRRLPGDRRAAIASMPGDYDRVLLIFLRVKLPFANANDFGPPEALGRCRLATTTRPGLLQLFAHGPLAKVLAAFHLWMHYLPLPFSRAFRVVKIHHALTHVLVHEFLALLACVRVDLINTAAMRPGWGLSFGSALDGTPSSPPPPGSPVPPPVVPGAGVPAPGGRGPGCVVFDFDHFSGHVDLGWANGAPRVRG